MPDWAFQWLQSVQPKCGARVAQVAPVMEMLCTQTRAKTTMKGAYMGCLWEHTGTTTTKMKPQKSRLQGKQTLFIPQYWYCKRMTWNMQKHVHPRCQTVLWSCLVWSSKKTLVRKNNCNFVRFCIQTSLSDKSLSCPLLALGPRAVSENSLAFFSASQSSFKLGTSHMPHSSFAQGVGCGSMGYLSCQITWSNRNEACIMNSSSLHFLLAGWSRTTTATLSLSLVFVDIMYV